MVINHNIAALNTFNQLSANEKSASASLQKLSSGLRINSAADDAAGLAISQKMQSQINGLDQATSNAQDGISLVQTADGALSETQSILQRMNTLATQASNDTNTTQDRTDMQTEINQLEAEIDRIGNTTQFNTKDLLNGGAGVDASITGTDASKVTVVGGTADTKATGSVAMTAWTAATGASTVSTATYTAATDNVGASTISLNGHSFSFTATDTAQDVIDQVNEAGIGVNASYDTTNNVIKFSSVDVGSAADISISNATGDFAGAVKTAGSDAVITATGSPTYTAKGNSVTITSGNAKGLNFNVSGNSAAGANITVNANNGLNMQIGANEGQTMYIGIGDMRAAALGVNNIDLSSAASAGAAITTIQNAIDTVSTQRANLGAYQNRLQHTVNNLNTESQNLQSASSQITDVDMASEMSNYTKNNILVQSATAMLAQANQLPQSVLTLLK